MTESATKRIISFAIRDVGAARSGASGLPIDRRTRDKAIGAQS
jgi:hypothetical protein